LAHLRRVAARSSGRLPTHAQLRRAVRAVNEVLSALHLEKHPDKTFIGKIERGFDFLGYRFGAVVLQLAQATIEKFVEQATRLYEQGRRERRKAPLLGRYVRRWLGWANGGLVETGERCGGHGFNPTATPWWLRVS
jgi:hypothetical protein